MSKPVTVAVLFLVVAGLCFLQWLTVHRADIVEADRLYAEWIQLPEDLRTLFALIDRYGGLQRKDECMLVDAMECIPYVVRPSEEEVGYLLRVHFDEAHYLRTVVEKNKWIIALN